MEKKAKITAAVVGSIVVGGATALIYKHQKDKQTKKITENYILEKDSENENDWEKVKRKYHKLPFQKK